MISMSPTVKHLVLIGGGHSHLTVLKQLGMHPIPGLAVTLISRDINVPYSGLLPGFISGIYKAQDIYIDLRPLAQFAKARIIQADIQKIDLDGKEVTLPERPNISFDLLSLNIGSEPNLSLIPGAKDHSIGIKPLPEFLKLWPQILERAKNTLAQNQEFKFIIVGGGPASVELAFSIHHRLKNDPNLKNAEQSNLQIQIISAENTLLKFHNNRVQSFTAKELANRNIDVLLKTKMSACEAGVIVCEDQTRLKADAIICATGASLPSWPAECGLAISQDGFIEVDSTLKSTSHDYVFAAGDSATIKGQTRPKSGVYAVRQGIPLAKNLVRHATNRRLISYKPQTHALALINTCNKSAIASRGSFFMYGRLAWIVKDRIDINFVKKYSNLPQMNQRLDLAKGLVDNQTEELLRSHAMRCAGCGAKVANNVLQDVLHQLPNTEKKEIATNFSSVEDASLIQLEGNKVLLQSIDQIKAFVNDPWIFARIATNHCLSDIYAMGCKPHSALAIVGLPFASKEYSRTEFRQLMLSCSETLKEQNCSLIGGHSAESEDLTFGLCVNGFTTQDKVLCKSGMKKGDVLILTKSLGTGTLLAADMRSKASHLNIQNALNEMAISNQEASSIFLRMKATACTDITGFGLAGHLIEMLMKDNIEVSITLDDIPIMNGALYSLKQGVFSSLHADNRTVSSYISGKSNLVEMARYEILFDPQTSGGLLASIPSELAAICLNQLLEAGYESASVIGKVSNINTDEPKITIEKPRDS